MGAAALRSGDAAMCIYFHLKDSGQAMPDDDGVEVSEPEEARDQALQAVEELRRNDALLVRMVPGGRRPGGEGPLHP